MQYALYITDLIFKDSAIQRVIFSQKLTICSFALRSNEFLFFLKGKNIVLTSCCPIQFLFLLGAQLILNLKHVQERTKKGFHLKNMYDDNFKFIFITDTTTTHVDTFS